VGLVCQAWLTPRIGVSGAAAATLAGYVGVAGFTYLLAQRVHPLPYRGFFAGGLFMLALGLGLTAERLAPPGALGVAARMAAVGVFVMVCWRARVWTERAAVAPTGS